MDVPRSRKKLAGLVEIKHPRGVRGRNPSFCGESVLRLERGMQDETESDRRQSLPVEVITF
jgi:hypothetical protein